MRSRVYNKHIIAAAMQSSSQYRSTREALRKARIEEEAAVAKEAKRQAQEKEKEMKRKRQAEEREDKKSQKKEEKERESRRQKEEDEGGQDDKHEEDDDGGRKTSRRKVKGFEELDISDFPILVNRFPDYEMQIENEMDGFLQACLRGLPVVWRSKRPQIKKILESDGNGYSSKQAQATNQIIQNDLKEFISEFANVCEREPEKVKSTRLPSTEAQGAHEALSLDFAVQGALEKNATENPGSDIRATLLDRSLL